MEQQWGGRGEREIKRRAEIKAEGAWREVGGREDQRGKRDGGEEAQAAAVARQTAWRDRQLLPARRAARAWHQAGMARGWHRAGMARGWHGIGLA